MTASNTFRCFIDICDSYSQYCVEQEERCYHCKDISYLCNSTTENLPSQCTRFCVDYLSKQRPAGASDSYEVPFFVMLGLGLALLILVVVLIVLMYRRKKQDILVPSKVFDVENQRLINSETAKGDNGSLQSDETNSNYTGKKSRHPQVEIDSIVQNVNDRSSMTTSRTSMGRQVSQEETENDMEVVRHRNNDGHVDSSVNSGGVDPSNSGSVDTAVNSRVVDSSVNSGRVDSSNSGGVDSSVNSGGVDSSVNRGGVDSSVNSGGVDSSVNRGGVDSSVNRGGVDSPENSSSKTRHETRNGSINNRTNVSYEMLTDLHNKLNTIPPCQDKEGKHAETVYS